MAEGVELRVGERARNEEECEVEVCEGEKGEHERDELVDELDVEEGFAPDGVIRSPDLLEVQEGVDGGEEGTIEPTATLGDKFGHGIYRDSLALWEDRVSKSWLTGHICLSCCSLYIL